MNSPELISSIVNLIALVFAITSHEAAHGAMALVFGDDTAKRHGRLTLNPLKHIDPLGSIILPGFLYLVHSPMLFGWAKPVPVNFSALKYGRIGTIMVAFAGPGTNMVIAWLSALLVHFSGTGNILSELLVNSLNFNLFLAVFNLIPLLPLDGGRILGGLLPEKLREPYSKMERYGLGIFMGLLFLPNLLKPIGIHFDPISMILDKPFQMLMKIVLVLSGHHTD
jgi:Zn-dependent protease